MCGDVLEMDWSPDCDSMHNVSLVQVLSSRISASIMSQFYMSTPYSSTVIYIETKITYIRIEMWKQSSVENIILWGKYEEYSFYYFF